MSEPIQPAISADRWAAILDPPHKAWKSLADAKHEALRAKDDAGMIALCNEDLPGEDRRKITWDWVDELLGVAESIDGEWGAGRGDDPRAMKAVAIANALASYLPPRKTT